MFDFLKKKLKEVFSRTEKEIEKEAVEEKKEIEHEVKEIEKEEVEIVEEIKKIEEPEVSAEAPIDEDALEENAVEKETPHEEIEEGIQESVPIEEIKKEETPLEEHLEKLEEKKEGFFARLKKTFTTTKITDNDFERFFAELELALIENNVAIDAIDELKKNLKEQLENKDIKRGKIEDEIKSALEKAVSELLIEPFDLVDRIKESVKEKKPYVIAFFGINGVGKTLTIAKVAHLLKENNITSVMAASDTFRAAAIEQLEKHAEKIDIEIVKQKYGSDPAAVAYDAISHAKSKGTDVVLIDTAGRINSKANLMREMEKIIRVTTPDLKIFVGESIAGNDLIEQVKTFDETAGIDALILTKADVDERGGACISVSHVTGKPILFLGAGQEYSELKKFDKAELLNAIFG